MKLTIKMISASSDIFKLLNVLQLVLNFFLELLLLRDKYSTASSFLKAVIQLAIFNPLLVLP